MRAPVQGAFGEQIDYCIDCHRLFVAVPADRFEREYVWVNPKHPVGPESHVILQFRR